MLTTRYLTVLMSLSLTGVAVQARADEAPTTAEPAQAAEQQQPAPASADWTWFGMGFESRQERFRREMDAAVPGVGGSADTSGAGGGQSNGHGGGK